MLPEPAAYYIWSLARQIDESAPNLLPPPQFELSPGEVNEGNYLSLAALYEATGIEPPPEYFVTIPLEKAGGPNPEEGAVFAAEQIAIFEGYEYLTHDAQPHWQPNTGGLTVDVSDSYQEPGMVAVIVQGWGITGYTFYVHILCRRTARAVEQWRHKTWEALLQGHQRQVAIYDEKLAALAAQEGIKISGRNPVTNRKIEREELKKWSIVLLTGNHPFWLNGTVDTGLGPMLNMFKVESHGAYVRFFEQAFEWENMSYVFYPYFWARVMKWLELNAIDDVDPLFRAFLTAGWARVVVPVRPGFQSAVEHFRQTGQIWSGGDLPDIADPDSLPIVEELKERLDAPGEELPVGPAWDVVVPTQLVRLRPDSSLPRWEKQQDGTWQEV
jgi:hypothetical protein